MPGYRRKNLSRDVKRCMKRLSEKKHLTTNTSTNAVSSAGTIVLLNALVQGTTAGTRIGNQANFTKLSIRGNVYDAATNPNGLVRLIYFIDHAADNAGCVVADVLESASWYAPYNLDKVGSRFKILHDTTFTIQNSAPTVTIETKVFHKEMKLDTTTFYTANGGTITDILKNAVYMLMISGSGTEGLQVNNQMCYVDL